MSTPSFSNVPSEGFVAFASQLTAGDWGSINTSDWETPEHTAAKPLGDAPTLVTLKLSIAWAIGALLQAQEGAAGAKQRDTNWDNAQKQLKALLQAASSSSDSQKREAAGRLQKSLLTGAGEGQTKLKYQQEVDFGHKQAQMIAQGQAAADVALLGLGNVMAEIAQTTAALAEAIGHGESADRPYERQRGAVAGCASVCGRAAETLAWLADWGMPGTDRELASRLLASLHELQARYAAPAKSGGGKQQEDGSPPAGGAAPPES